MLPPPALASRDVGNDDEVLLNTYNAIVPHKESNVNIWFGRPFDKLRTGSPQAVRRARSSLLWPMFSALMMRPRNAPGAFSSATQGAASAGASVRLRSTFQRKAEYQTAWAVFVVRIVFDDLAIRNHFADFLHANLSSHLASSSGALPRSIARNSLSG